MKSTIKHEISRASTWGLGIVTVLGSMYPYLPELKVLVPPPVFAAIAGAALVAKVFQKSRRAKP